MSGDEGSLSSSLSTCCAVEHPGDPGPAASRPRTPVPASDPREARTAWSLRLPPLGRCWSLFSLSAILETSVRSYIFREETEKGKEFGAPAEDRITERGAMLPVGGQSSPCLSRLAVVPVATFAEDRRPLPRARNARTTLLPSFTRGFPSADCS